MLYTMEAEFSKIIINIDNIIIYMSQVDITTIMCGFGLILIVYMECKAPIPYSSPLGVFCCFLLHCQFPV